MMILALLLAGVSVSSTNQTGGIVAGSVGSVNQSGTSEVVCDVDHMKGCFSLDATYSSSAPLEVSGPDGREYHEPCRDAAKDVNWFDWLVVYMNNHNYPHVAREYQIATCDGYMAGLRDRK